MTNDTGAVPPVPAGQHTPPRNCPFCKRIKAGEYDYDDPNCVAFQPLSSAAGPHTSRRRRSIHE